MFHVSFRYIFGIPPLILVLLPVASSDCDIEGKDGRVYQHVLMISINDLDTMIKNRTNCPNNEPKVLKKHACDDNKEGIFLYRAARKLKQFVKVNNSEDFNLHLSRVSQGTLQLLNCTPKEGIKLPYQHEVQPTKNLIYGRPTKIAQSLPVYPLQVSSKANTLHNHGTFIQTKKFSGNGISEIEPFYQFKRENYANVDQRKTMRI